jgi:hypothetical protein
MIEDIKSKKPSFARYRITEPQLSLPASLTRIIITMNEKDIAFTQRCWVTVANQDIEKFSAVIPHINAKGRHGLPEGAPAGGEHARLNCLTRGQERQEQPDHIVREGAQAVLATSHSHFVVTHVAESLGRLAELLSCAETAEGMSKISFQGRRERWAKKLKIRPALRFVPLFAASGIRLPRRRSECSDSSERSLLRPSAK